MKQNFRAVTKADLPERFGSHPEYFPGTLTKTMRKAKQKFSHFMTKTTAEKLLMIMNKTMTNTMISTLTKIITMTKP